MATPKEIQARIKLLTTEAEKLNQIYQLDNRRTTALKESLKIQREILKLENLMKGVYGDISKTLVTVAKKSKEIKFNQKDTFGFQKNLNKQVAENLKLNMALLKDKKIDKSLAEQIHGHMQNIVNETSTLESIEYARQDIHKALEVAMATQNQELYTFLQGTLKTLSADEKRLKITKMINNTVAAADDLFGNMGTTIKEMILNPLTLAAALLVTFNSQQESIGKEFGAIGVTEFRDDLADASQEFVRLGFEGTEALSTIKSLSSEFGIGVKQAKEMSDEVANLSKSTGLALEDSTKLMGIFTETQGLTAEASINLLKSAEMLAHANDVAPNVVLKDVANNTEMFAKFSKDGGKNILRAAIQARKLGISLDKVGTAAEGLLDFQSSLNAEVEASILLGRNLNLQKARELALAGKTDEVMTELVKQAGSAAEFSEMNVIQRKALARALNMELGDLQKIVNKQEEQVSLAGKLEEASAKNLVPEATITATAELLANLKALGMEMAETLGPALNTLVSGLVGFVGVLEQMGVLLPLIAGYMAFLTAKTILNTYATIQKEMADRRAAKASLVKAAAEGAEAAAETASAIPIVGWALAIAGLVALGVAIAGFMGAFETGSELGGVQQDGVAALHKGETILNKDDTKMLEKQQAAVKGGVMGATSVTNVNTSTLERQNKELKSEIGNMRKDFAGYFGVGGTLAKETGKRVGSRFNEAKRG